MHLLSKSKVRERVYVKAGGRCWYCSINISPFYFHIDHFYPQSKHPELANKIGNLVPTCRECNLEKNDRSVEYMRAFLVGGSGNYYYEDNLLFHLKRAAVLARHDGGSTLDSYSGEFADDAPIGQWAYPQKINWSTREKYINPFTRCAIEEVPAIRLGWIAAIHGHRFVMDTIRAVENGQYDSSVAVQAV